MFNTCIVSFQTSFFSQNNHLVYTLPIVVCSLLFNVPRFFELRTEMRPVNVTSYNLDNGTNTTEQIMMPTLLNTEFRMNQSYSRDYILIANAIALVFFPMVVLLVLNSLIFREISRATQRHNAISSHQRRDHSVAKMLIFIVCCFIVCHSIR